MKRLHVSMTSPSPLCLGCNNDSFRHACSTIRAAFLHLCKLLNQQLNASCVLLGLVTMIRRTTKTSLQADYMRVVKVAVHPSSSSTALQSTPIMMLLVPHTTASSTNSSAINSSSSRACTQEACSTLQPKRSNSYTSISSGSSSSSQ
jgi:hypothetical protein